MFKSINTDIFSSSANKRKFTEISYHKNLHNFNESTAKNHMQKHTPRLNVNQKHGQRELIEPYGSCSSHLPFCLCFLFPVSQLELQYILLPLWGRSYVCSELFDWSNLNRENRDCREEACLRVKRESNSDICENKNIHLILLHSYMWLKIVNITVNRIPSQVGPQFNMIDASLLLF